MKIKESPIVELTPGMVKQIENLGRHPMPYTGLAGMILPNSTIVKQPAKRGFTSLCYYSGEHLYMVVEYKGATIKIREYDIEGKRIVYKVPENVVEIIEEDEEIYLNDLL